MYLGIIVDLFPWRRYYFWKAFIKVLTDLKISTPDTTTQQYIEDRVKQLRPSFLRMKAVNYD